MLRFFCVLFLFLVAGCATTPATVDTGIPENPDIDLTDSLNQLSYAAGYKLGDMFQNQKLTARPEAVVKGMYDARKNIDPVMTKAEMKVILSDPKAFLVAGTDAKIEATVKDGKAFLQENAKRDGVVELSSGLQYKVLSEGQGRLPEPLDRVQFNYVGKQLNGNVFDSTVKRGKPAEVTLKTLVPGLVEGMQLMNEGSKWEFYLPSDLAYGMRGPLSGKTLIFEIELLKVL